MDTNNDGFITWEEMRQCTAQIDNCIIEDSEERKTHDWETIFRRIDQDRDGKISYPEFMDGASD